MPSGRSYVAGHLLLEIGGASAGFIRKVEGGGISAEISSGAGPSFFANKHPGSVVYEDVTVEAGVDMGSPFWDWIKVTLEGKYELKDVSIVACDYDLHAQSTRHFRSAVITEITFPDLDASSKDPVYVRVKFAPEVTHSEKG